MILEGLEHGTTSPPTRADIIRWCCFAMNDLPEHQMVKNAWRHAEYSWFLPLPAAENYGNELHNVNAPGNDHDDHLDSNESDNDKRRQIRQQNVFLVRQ
jgi:hypothetical protein